MSDWGYIAAGLLTGYQGFDQTSNSQWQEYRQGKQLQKMQDYLVCMTESTVSRAVYELKEFMDEVCVVWCVLQVTTHPRHQTRLQLFNNNVDAVTATLAMNCRPHNCLNFTNIEPSVRNNASGMNCVVPYASVDCANVTTWNPLQPKRCTADGVDETRGVCGMDKQCYASGTTIAKVTEQYKDLRRKFFHDSTIAQFQAFNKYE